MFLEGQVDRQTDRRVHRRPKPKQYPSDFIGGNSVLSTGYLVSCSRTQRSASGKARTRNPSISGQALYHDCTPQLGSILCRYDTCPTQYAPDLRGSILCMQGTQNAPRESILCMEHFVALHTNTPAVEGKLQRLGNKHGLEKMTNINRDLYFNDHKYQNRIHTLQLTKKQPVRDFNLAWPRGCKKAYPTHFDLQSS